MELPNLNGFDLDYSELTSLRIDWAHLGIAMTIKCPSKGWRWKKSLPLWIRTKVLSNPNLVTEVTLQFLDADAIRGTLLDAANMAIASNLFDHGFPVVADLRFLKSAAGRGHAHLEFDDGVIEFEFGDCVQREVGILSFD